jgi:hypothetical protein
VVRRLDGVSQALAQLQSDVDVLSQAVALVARYAFMAGPGRFGPEAIAQGEKVYRDFLVGISKGLASGVKLAGEVRRVLARPPSAPAGSGTGTGTPGRAVGMEKDDEHESWLRLRIGRRPGRDNERGLSFRARMTRALRAARGAGHSWL